MAYTVQQLAKLANISVRTLHYYDKTGLLKPSHVKANGYRYYEQKELIRLQQILFLRELEFSLKDIKQIISSPQFDTLEALQEQKKMLLMKRKRLDELLKTIINTIESMRKRKDMKADEMYGSFSKKQMEEYKQEAKERWGNTEAWKQSQERTKNWTKEDYARVQKEGGAILNEIVRLMDKGIEDPSVQVQIGKYREHLSTFYDIPVDMYRCLGNMYSDDHRFTAFYEKIHEGLAAFMTKAINYYCDQEENK